MAGIYQSRVFNFIGGHTNRLKNSLAQGWRQVKISVQWTGQILLAPWHWLQRFSQNLDRQIAGPDRPPLPMGKEALPTTPDPAPTSTSSAPLNAARANQAIEHLLAEVVAAGHGLSSTVASTVTLTRSTYEDWSVIDEQDWDTSLLDESNLSLAGKSTPLPPGRPVIQGLATLLTNGHLVLIDRHNQVLDVLSPSQQLHLRQQIDPATGRALPPSMPKLGSSHPALAAPDSHNLSNLSAAPVNDPHPLPPAVPAVPQTLWQKVSYWGHYYLEYLRVDSGDAPPPQPALMLPSAFKLPAPFQQSIAIIPRAIAALTAPINAPNHQTENTASSASSAIETIAPVTIDLANHPAPSPIETNTANKKSAGQSESLATKTDRPIETTKAQNLTQTSAQNSARTQVTFQPQWIDAPTEDLGYEKSLWQRFWEWLDRIVLAIENWVLSIYQQR